MQTSLAASGVNVHASTIRQKFNRHDIHGRVARKKPLLSRKNKAARLNFAREHLDKPEAFWKSILWTDESTRQMVTIKTAMFGVFQCFTFILKFSYLRESLLSLGSYAEACLPTSGTYGDGRLYFLLFKVVLFHQRVPKLYTLMETLSIAEGELGGAYHL